MSIEQPNPNSPSTPTTTAYVVFGIRTNSRNRPSITTTNPLSTYQNVELADLIAEALGISSKAHEQTHLVRITLQVEVLETLTKPTPSLDEANEAVDDALPPQNCTVPD